MLPIPAGPLEKRGVERLRCASTRAESSFCGLMFDLTERLLWDLRVIDQFVPVRGLSE